jgi:hypothetical protein
VHWIFENDPFLEFILSILQSFFPGMNPVEIQSFEPPWKNLTDFGLHGDLDRINAGPHFQHLVNQVQKVKSI